MPYRLAVTPEAEEEAKEAARWYGQQKSGLGEEFLKSLEGAYKAIAQSPTIYRSRFRKKVRACLLNRFPYLVLYSLEKKTIVVISVFHTGRNPEIWKKRVK